MVPRIFRGNQLHLQVRNSYNRSLVSTVGTGIPDPLSMRSKKQLRSVERLVGYPTPLLSLRHLIGSELTQLSVQVRRLLASEHPIVNHSRLVCMFMYAVILKFIICLLLVI